MRSESYYEPFVFTSFIVTSVVVIVCLLVLAGLMRTKVEKISPKIFYFYIMSFISLLFLVDGISVLITMIADLIVALGVINIDIKKAFITCISLLLVALPSYLFHWTRVLKGLDAQDEEKVIWPYYIYMLLGLTAIASLTFIGTWFHQMFSLLLGVSEFNWDIANKVLGYGAVGLLSWVYHWKIKKRSVESANKRMEIKAKQ